ncbi:tRNA (adenosine(37)-N6)-threonylcarbamoyltransferase complex transferase subunit TsaD [Candidatus Saccharibacteria bacterium]|nr:tRNA (adenosine(37)-N6)-threonylcarbamoyltransferase complex transferase subunit TsaD [Candidatus Saccharibacteria bacterium]
MKILGIETSCDETAASVVEDGKKILSNVVVSQIDIFSAYGGVIPEVAARSHLEVILPVIDKSLSDANLTWDNIDAIAVTHTPGLLGSLLIGTLTARTLAILHSKPLYPVHHLKSHIYANWIEKSGIKGQIRGETTSTRGFPEVTTEEKTPKPRNDGREGRRSPEEVVSASELMEKSVPSFPLLAMVISGGHTQILYMKRHNHFEIIGTTHDDAIGECFDKVAKILGLPYPGGPSISNSAKLGDKTKYKLPHPKVENLDFSFSGLKTAVLRAVQKDLGLPISHPSHDLKNHLTKQQVADFSASFEKTAVDILLEKISLALNEHPDVKSIVFAGGVSANELLRKKALLHFSKPATIRGETTSTRGFPKVTTEEKTPKPRNDGREGRRSPEEVVSASEFTLQKNIGVFFPEKSLSGDNGAMVASACFYEIESGVKPADPYKINILPRSEIK